MSEGTRGEIGRGGRFQGEAKGQIIANIWDRRA